MAASCAGGILQQTVLDRITGRPSQATDGPTACAICLTDFGDAPVWPWPAGCGHLLHKDSFAQLLAASGSEAAYRPSCQRGQQGRFRLCPCVHGYWERCFHEHSRGTTCDHQRWVAVDGCSLCLHGGRAPRTQDWPYSRTRCRGRRARGPIGFPGGWPEADGGGGHGGNPIQQPRARRRTQAKLTTARPPPWKEPTTVDEPTDDDLRSPRSRTPPSRRDRRRRGRRL